MVATEEKTKTEPKQFEVLDALKFLYALLNTVGGKASIPAKMLDNMPKDWMDRLKFEHDTDLDLYTVSVKPRRQRGIIKPKRKKLILPN